MVLLRFNLLLPRLKAPCGASYPRKFLPNLMGNFSLTADSDSRIFCGIASSRSGIGPEILCHPLNQSDNKPRTKRAWPLVFSRASGSLPVLTLKSDWLLVTFPFVLIALFCFIIVLLFYCITIFPIVINWVSKNRDKSYHNLLPVRTNVTIIIVQ